MQQRKYTKVSGKQQQMRNGGNGGNDGSRLIDDSIMEAFSPGITNSGDDATKEIHKSVRKATANATSVA